MHERVRRACRGCHGDARRKAEPGEKAHQPMAEALLAAEHRSRRPGRRRPGAGLARAAQAARATAPPAAAPRSAASAGRARRPWSSQASNVRGKGLPLRWRASSTIQRPRAPPACGKGADGAEPTRQRVAVADGSASGQTSRLRQRRNKMAGLRPSAAASCRELRGRRRSAAAAAQRRSMSDGKDKKDRGVGRGRPPAHIRFKPGVSGNPKGRPRKRPLLDMPYNPADLPAAATCCTA